MYTRQVASQNVGGPSQQPRSKMSAKLILTSNPQRATDFIAKQENIELKNNPDVIFINESGESIKISQVRQLSQDILYRPLKEKHKSFILLNFDLATIPAQNAFLKSLEEPPEHIKFYLVAENLQNILPTVQSRCQIINLRSDNGKPSAEEVGVISGIYGEICDSSYGAKIDLAAQYKDRAEAEKLLFNLLKHIHTLNQAEPSKNQLANLRLISESLKALKANANVALTLERCFFGINS